MLIATLILLTLTGAAIFAAPLRCKAWVALAFVVLFALGGTAAAVGALAGILPPAGLSLPTLLFGEESLRMDALSGLFTLLVAAGSVAAALYAKGYVDRYTFDRKPAAHISLHYFAFTLLSLSMMAVVTASGELYVPLLVGADDPFVVRAHPLRRRTQGGAQSRADLSGDDAPRLLRPAHRLRGPASRRGIGRFRRAGGLLRRTPPAAAAARLPRGLRHESRPLPHARLAPRSAPSRPVARLGTDVGRDDQDGRLRRTAHGDVPSRRRNARHGRRHPAGEQASSRDCGACCWPPCRTTSSGCWPTPRSKTSGSSSSPSA